MTALLPDVTSSSTRQPLLALKSENKEAVVGLPMLSVGRAVMGSVSCASDRAGRSCSARTPGASLLPAIRHQDYSPLWLPTARPFLVQILTT